MVFYEPEPEPKLAPADVLGAPVVIGGQCIGMITAATSGPDHTIVAQMLADPENDDR